MAFAVLDCSFVLAWGLDEETFAGGLEVLEKAARAGAVVPNLWVLEVANGLLTAVRRKRITPARGRDILTAIGNLRVTIDDQTQLYAWSRTYRLAQHHSLSMYDAAYLELATRNGIALATLDEKLALAAKAEGLLVLPA